MEPQDTGPNEWQGRDLKRAWRRHHRHRMIARAKRIYGHGRFPHDPELLAEMQAWAHRNHRHLKKCSCWLCSRRRQLYGPTIQERRMEQGASDREGRAH